uniref:Rieske domain-containing protein n=1 Tax=Arcella intermedia TaxID=1963864 RepID=A0A6B2LS12_9EUKA
MLIYHNGGVVALDAVCYHMGGPLVKGDIEDIGGISCLRCPWHGYKINIETGERVVVTNGQVEYQAKRQRTHQVRILGDQIYVTLNLDPQELPSDRYAYKN